MNIGLEWLANYTFRFFFSFSFFNVGLMLEYFKLLGSGTVFYPFKMFALKLNKGELVWWSTSNIFMIDNFQGIWSGMLSGTILQTCVLFFLVYRTDWNKEVIVFSSYFCKLQWISFGLVRIEKGINQFIILIHDI